MKLFNLFLCLAILGFSQGASAQNIKTVTETFEGNTVSISVQIDTVQLEDPVTGEWLIRFEKLEKITTLNGATIYYGKDATEPVGAAAQSTFKDFVGNLVNEELKNAKNIHSMDIVIDDKGEVGFIRFLFLKSGKNAEKETEYFRKKIMDRLKGIHFIPAKRNGKAVPYGDNIPVIK